MAIVVWVVEGTWPACVDAARRWVEDGQPVTLLHVAPVEVDEVVAGGLAGLFGRGRRPRPVASPELSGAALLEAAAGRLGRPVSTVHRTGRVEREVVAAAEGADLLVVARDGDRSRLGPHSLGPVTRFVVDHAPCPVLLVWPGDVPSVGSIPPPPPTPRLTPDCLGGAARRTPPPHAAVRRPPCPSPRVAGDVVAVQPSRRLRTDRPG